MPLKPSFVERLVLFRLNLGPAPMLDFLGALGFRAACAAYRLGVFDVLRRGPATAADVAHEIDAGERGVLLLLRALASLGYVEERRERFRLSPMSAKWIPMLGDGIRFFERMAVEEWGYLEDRIRNGPPTFREFYERFDDSRWREFEAGMVAVARMTGGEVVRKAKLPANARRLLDVGGGHGLYSVKFCERYPELRATVFDLPQALEVASNVIESEGMGNRVSVQAGDYWVDDLGSGYDVVLVFNILHQHLPDRNNELLRRVAGALNPGGLVVILDQVSGKTLGRTARAGVSVTGLNMFLAGGGQTYAATEVAGWLRQSGFDRCRTKRLLRSPGIALVVGRKAA